MLPIFGHRACFVLTDMISNKMYAKYTCIAIFYFCTCTLCVILNNNYSIAGSFQLKNNTLEKKYDLFHTLSQLPSKLNDQLQNAAGVYKLLDGQRIPFPQSVTHACHHYNLTTALVKSHYLLDPKKTSLYCWIRKVASTSFTKLFSDLRERRISRDYYKEVDVLSPSTIEELESLIIDDKVFKFLVVRHPFERIVSSYRDRLEDNRKYTAQAWIYAQRIFHLTRPYLFHTNATTGTSLSRIFNNDRKLKVVPSFKEFITWLLREPTSKDDVHWDSYYSHCSVCDINYNFILKLEDYTVGVDFLFSKMGLNKHERVMQKLETTSGGPTDYERTCGYFKTLTQEMILKLYQRYQIDFQMFDYKHENYLKCAS